MEFKLSQALGPVRLKLMDVASKASSRRLMDHRKKISCKPSCAGCCSRMISVTVAEATVIYDHLVSAGTWGAVRSEARNQASEARKADPLAWFKMNRPCPVLERDSRLCLAYKVRPAACSTHFVTSDPDLCGPWSATSGRYEPADMDDLAEEFTEFVRSHVAKSGILSLELPMPVALLLAERISIRSGMELDEVVSLLFQELS